MPTSKNDYEINGFKIRSTQSHSSDITEESIQEPEDGDSLVEEDRKRSDNQLPASPRMRYRIQGKF